MDGQGVGERQESLHRPAVRPPALVGPLISEALKRGDGSAQPESPSPRSHQAANVRSTPYMSLTFLPLPLLYPNENSFSSTSGIRPRRWRPFTASLQFRITLLQRAIHGLTRLHSHSLSHSRARAPDSLQTPCLAALAAHSAQHSIFYRSWVGLRGVRPATCLGGPTVGAQRPGFWLGGGLKWAEVCVCVSSRSLF